MSIDNTKAGIILGAGAGSFNTIKGLIFNISSISIDSLLTAIIYAVIGGVFGWIGSEFMNLIKKKYLKWRNRKNDKEGN